MTATLHLLSKDKLHRLYVLEGRTLEQIARRCGCSRQTVLNRLRAHGLPVRKTTERIPVDRIELERLYLEKQMSLAEIGARFGRRASTVLYWMRKYGIPRRAFPEAAALNGPRGPGTPGVTARYTQNDEFFSAWSPAMAWVLGLVYTDGTITQKRAHHRRVELSSKDLDMLEQVKRLVESDRPVRKVPGKNMHVFTLGNTRMCEALLAIGLTPNKTRTIAFPEVPAELLPHFVRGLWDGDGWVTARWRKHESHHRPHLDLTLGYVSGSEGFVVALEEQIRQLVGLHGTVSSRGTYWRLAYHGQQARTLARWLHQNSTPRDRMARKYDRLAAHLGEDFASSPR